MSRAMIAASLATALWLATVPAFAQDETTTYGDPGSITISYPSVSHRSAYIDQIGDGNVATIEQRAPDAYAKIKQKGADNTAGVTQGGTGLAYADVRQTGDLNSVIADQRGGGANALYTVQNGDANIMIASQRASAGAENGAVLSQMGDGNTMSLTQDGEDNRAILTQNGDGNTMDATQNGAANRLVWTQDGNNLAGMSIIQSGGQAIQITQQN